MDLRSKNFNVQIPDDVSWSQFVFQNFKLHGSKTAVVDGLSGRSYTYDQLIELTSKCASSLTRQGFRKGKRLAIILPNIPEFPIIYFASISIGGLVTTVNPSYALQDLNHVCKEFGAEYVVTTPVFVSYFDRFGTGDETILEVAESDGFFPHSALIGDGARRVQFRRVVEINPKEDNACVLFTRATTGLPKGAILTHYNLVAEACVLSQDSVTSVNSSFVVLGLLPFCQRFGQVVLLSCTLIRGGKLVCLPKFEPKSFLEAIQEYKVSHMAVEPSTVLFLARSPQVGQCDLSSVKEITCVTSVAGVELVNHVMERLPSIECFRQCYGLTEFSSVCHITPWSSYDKPGSVGDLVPNLQCRVVDVSNGIVLGPNRDGEICLKGPTVMKGYLDNSEATVQTIDGDGWLHTGDVGHYDEYEDFWIFDRLEELIHHQGFQISPAELESLLLLHPAVQYAVVVGVWNLSEGSEVPKAFIVQKDDQQITAEEVEKFVAANVEPHQQLRGGVEFLSKGKLSLNYLRRKAKERVADMKTDREVKTYHQGSGLHSTFCRLL